MGGYGNGGGEVFRSNERRPSYIDSGQQFLRTVNELKEKLSRKEELGRDLKVLKARDDTDKGDIYALKSQIKANKIDIKKLQRDKRNTWRQLKIEVGYDIEKNHKYRFGDITPDHKKWIRMAGLSDAAFVGATIIMSVFGEQANRILGFPTSAEVYGSVIVGFALNTLLYGMMKISEKISDSTDGSVKQKKNQILEEYRDIRE
ncbi:MAG: hypothetical protein KGH53_03520 [Candidatus Micrarchaeota archaeon]|nr:hypothetical protein [Candidatus Micrarchaeota archaeon]